MQKALAMTQGVYFVQLTGIVRDKVKICEICLKQVIKTLSY